jgi:hypothetical protein
MEADTCRKYVVPKLQAAGWENVAEISGKFGVSDHLAMLSTNCNRCCMVLNKRTKGGRHANA